MDAIGLRYQKYILIMSHSHIFCQIAPLYMPSLFKRYRESIQFGGELKNQITYWKK